MRLLAPEAKIEVLASGFNWSEGPVWKDGGIVFSDVPENTVFGWKEGEKAASVVLKPSGSLNGKDGQGSNGLAVDAQGQLVLCQHGERRVARLEKDGSFTAIADRFEGKRFNSPNDLVIAKSGSFTSLIRLTASRKAAISPNSTSTASTRSMPSGKVSLIDKAVRFRTASL
jgi:gluconolactonase